jgi:hypothetical protein
MKTDSCGDSLWAIECGAEDVVATSDGNYAACGWGATLTKVTPNGEVLWQRQIRPWPHNVTSLCELKEGGFLLGGTVGWYESAYVARTSADGAVLWETRLPGMDGTRLYDVAQARDGDLILAGSTIFPCVSFLARLDADGGLRWQMVPESECNCLYGLVSTPDNGCIAAGGMWNGWFDRTWDGAIIQKVDEHGGTGPAGRGAGFPDGVGARGGARTAQRARAERLRSAMRGERGIR